MHGAAKLRIASSRYSSILHRFRTLIFPFCDNDVPREGDEDEEKMKQLI